MTRRDTRGILEIDPNIELKDYSGPFKPDLRFTDFSREQLAKCYLMAYDYLYGSIEAWANHFVENLAWKQGSKPRDTEALKGMGIYGDLIVYSYADDGWALLSSNSRSFLRETIPLDRIPKLLEGRL